MTTHTRFSILARAYARSEDNFKDWTPGMIKDGWANPLMKPESWEGRDAGVGLIEPTVILSVDLPWVPVQDYRARNALVAVSMVEALFDVLEAPGEVKTPLEILAAGLYLLTDADKLKSEPAQYMAALRSVIPLWHKFFVPSVIQLKAVFVVTVGMQSSEFDANRDLMDSPFQLPWGWANYRKVRYETDPSLSPRVSNSEPWHVRARMF